MIFTGQEGGIPNHRARLARTTSPSRAHALVNINTQGVYGIVSRLSRLSYPAPARSIRPQFKPCAMASAMILLLKYPMCSWENAKGAPTAT